MVLMISSPTSQRTAQHPLDHRSEWPDVAILTGDRRNLNGTVCCEDRESREEGDKRVIHAAHLET